MKNSLRNEGQFGGLGGNLPHSNPSQRNPSYGDPIHGDPIYGGLPYNQACGWNRPSPRLERAGLWAEIATAAATIMPGLLAVAALALGAFGLHSSSGADGPSMGEQVMATVVAPRGCLRLRDHATTKSQARGCVPDGTELTLRCHAHGQEIRSGADSPSTDRWQLVSYDGISGYVSDAYLSNPDQRTSRNTRQCGTA